MLSIVRVIACVDQAPALCDNSRMVVDPDSIDVSKLSPGEYFRAGSYLVLTPSYFRNRGECCNSGCRQCPFRDLECSEEKSE